MKHIIKGRSYIDGRGKIAVVNDHFLGLVLLDWVESGLQSQCGEKHFYRRFRLRNYPRRDNGSIKDLAAIPKQEACMYCTLAECNEASTRCAILRRKGQMDAKYYEANKEAIKERMKGYYKANSDTVKRRVSNWKRDNRDLVAEQQRRYRARRVSA